MAWWHFVIWAVTTVISFVLTPKPEPPKPASLQDVQVPNSREGQPLRVLFGTRDQKAAAVVWYGNFSTEPIRKKAGKK